MLTKFLRAAHPTKFSIEYVGSYVEGFTGTSSNKTISLTSLTGGIASAPDTGDLVLVYFGTGSTVDRNLVVSGYTEITELYANDTYDTNLAVAYKFITATLPDTSLTLTGGTLSSSDGGAVYISVWRNVDTISTFDVTTTTATAIDSGLCNPPAITPITSGSYVVSGGASGNTSNGTFTSSDLTDFKSVHGSDTNGVTIGGGYRTWTSGAINPAAFTLGGSGNSINYSWAAVTLALRPKTKAPLTLLELVSSTTSESASLTAPTNIFAGDLLFFTQRVPDCTTATAPSGFTDLVLSEASALDHRTSYKIATGTEGGTSITGSTGSSYASTLLVFRGGNWTSVSTGTWGSQGVDTDPSSQTVTAQTGKIIVLGSTGSRGASTTGFQTQSPAFDNVITLVNSNGDSISTGYKIYQADSVSHTIDVTDNGSRNTLQSGYLKLT